MSQAQFGLLDIATEFLQSIGIELTVFAMSLLVAAAFRGFSFSEQDARAQKTAAKDPRRKIHAEQVPKASPVRSGNLASKKARTPIHELTQMMDSMVGTGNRWQAADAIALYEGMRAKGQHAQIIEALTSCKETLPNVFGQLVHCAGRVDRADLIEPLLDDMKVAGAERSLGLYESIMKTLASKKLYREAMSVYSRLQLDGLEPSPVTLSCLINFAIEIGEYDKAVAFFDQLSAKGAPTIRACMTIMRVHSKRQDWTKSISLIRDMQNRKTPVDCLVLNVVLATGAAAGEFDATKALLKEFSRIVDVISYNTVLKGFAQQKDADGAIDLLNEMSLAGVKPTAITFNTIMDAAVRSSRVADAWRVLARMRDAGLSPDKFTCTTLLKGLQDGTTSAQLSVILDFLQHVTAECDPSLCSSLVRSVIEATLRFDDPLLKAKVAALMRENQNVLPREEYQRLLQLVTRDRPTACASHVVPPWRRAPSEMLRPVSVQ